MAEKQKYQKNRKCVDCGKEISPQALRCKSCANTGELSSVYKGENAKYSAIHMWVRARKPIQMKCEFCNKEEKLELANISGKYKRDIKDFVWLCHKCHHHYDEKGLYFGINKEEESD